MGDQHFEYNAMNNEYFRDHNEQLEKSKVFINAMIHAGLNSDELKEELELY